MPTNKIYKVFVSSTFEDLREERAEVQKALIRMGCFPVGMEIFAASADDTWDFIKRQIAECDYYLVIVAGRYGSVAADGVSYTEKEYRFALEQNKRPIAFLHGNPGKIPAEHSERDPANREKLDKFLSDLKTRPIRTFLDSHSLALEVTFSFQQQFEQYPAEGYVRASDAVDFKKYARLLEDFQRVESELNQIKSRESQQSLLPEFAGYVELKFDLLDRTPAGIFHPTSITTAANWGNIFLRISSSVVQSGNETVIFAELGRSITYAVGQERPEGGSIVALEPPDGWRAPRSLRFNPSTKTLIRNAFFGWGLMDTRSDMTSGGPITTWALTELGRRQFQLLMQEG